MINSLINKLIILFIPLLPIIIIKKFAGKYVAGTDTLDAIKTVKLLNNKGFSATLDILGEHTKTANEAKMVTNEYLRIYDLIQDHKLDCNISVKPSHIGLDVNIDILRKNLDKLIIKAREKNNFLRLDMESSNNTEITISLFKEYFKKYTNTGTVFQAYLYRTKADINKLAKDFSFNFRLCKGIYQESKKIAIQNRQSINKNFLAILHEAFKSGLYVGIATHDIELIKSIYIMIEELKIPKDQFEFQVLYGVPMSGWNERHLENNYKVRVYIPFGEDWYPYSIRRLKENPQIARYVLKNLFKTLLKKKKGLSQDPSLEKNNKP